MRCSRSFAALGVATGLLLVLPRGVDATAEPDASTVLREAVRTLAVERQGFTAFHRHADAEQRAPGHNASLDVQSGLLRDGDRVVAVRIYNQIANGKPASADDLAKAQADADQKLANDEYWLPLRDDQIPDYKIAGSNCAQCAPGYVAIAFKSLKRDENHGDGTMIVDSATHHIVSIDFVPSALPKHVDKASVSITFGRGLPDLWDVVEMRQHYAGHVLFISGGADITTTLTNYRRFPTREEGLKALASGI